MKFILATIVWIIIGAVLGKALLHVAVAATKGLTVAAFMPLGLAVLALIVWMGFTGYRSH